MGGVATHRFHCKRRVLVCALHLAWMQIDLAWMQLGWCLDTAWTKPAHDFWCCLVGNFFGTPCILDVSSLHTPAPGHPPNPTREPTTRFTTQQMSCTNLSLSESDRLRSNMTLTRGSNLTPPGELKEAARPSAPPKPDQRTHAATHNPTNFMYEPEPV